MQITLLWLDERQGIWSQKPAVAAIKISPLWSKHNLDELRMKGK